MYTPYGIYAIACPIPGTPFVQLVNNPTGKQVRSVTGAELAPRTKPNSSACKFMELL